MRYQSCLRIIMAMMLAVAFCLGAIAQQEEADDAPIQQEQVDERVAPAELTEENDAPEEIDEEAGPDALVDDAADEEKPTETADQEEKADHPDEMLSREELDVAWREVKDNRNWEEGQKIFHSALRSAVIHIDDIEFLLVVTEPLYYRYRVCRYFPDIQESILDRGPRERFIDWLLENEDVTRRLVLAMDDRDDAPKVFSVLFDLVSAYERRVVEYPALAVAYAVVYDRATYSPEDVRDDFRYFTSRASDLALNPRDLSIELASFIVEARSTIEDKEWVFVRRFRLNNPEDVYTSIPLRVLRISEDQVGRKPSISLGAIHNTGGGPPERARFTVEAARALGVPAAHMRLDAATGESFTWPGYVEITRRGWEWKEAADDQTNNVTSLPAITDAPASGDKYTRSELQRLAWLGGLDSDSREARPLHVARRLAELAEAIGAPSDPAAFLPGRRGDDPEAALAALRLLRQAIGRDPISMRSWRAASSLARRYPEESKDALHDLFRILEAPRRHPELARDPHSRIEALRHLLSGVEDQNIQREMLARMLRAMRGSPPEFMGRLELMIADHLRHDSREAAYDRIKAFLNANPQAGPVALDMLERLTELGRELGRVDSTIAAYRNVYNRLPQPRKGAYAAWTLRYQVGRKLEALYAELGRDRDAVEIQRSLNALIQ